MLGDVVETADGPPGVRTIAIDCPGWQGHLPGQHVDIRLTAEDGYQVQRSYSIAAPADGERVVLTVERLDDGEVSPYLTDELRVSDEIELRGPIGGYFVWEPGVGGPLLLIAGGSGIVPLMAMLRARVTAAADVPVRMLYSSRSHGDVIYHDELERIGAGAGIGITHTLTRSQPPGWGGYARRIDRAMLAEVAWPPADAPHVFVCGPTGFVETAADALVSLGHDPLRIRTERFGPTGGPA
ncbi:MAG: ferredoxin reductase [Gaiellales bacterium]